MLIQVCLIVKNASVSIISCLESYVRCVDRFVILDTGSTDNTVELLHAFKECNNCKVIIKQSVFKGFDVSRNECLDIAYDKKYKWTIMVDDSYELVGSFDELKNIDSKISAVAIKIHNGPVNYDSLRIFETIKKYRYKGQIHEVLDAKCNYIMKEAYIKDVQYTINKERSFERAYYDLRILSNKKDARSLYMRANTIYQLYINGHKNINAAIDAYVDRVQAKDGLNDPEEIFMSLVMLAYLHVDIDVTKCLKYYISAAVLFPSRSGEAYFYAFVATGNINFLKAAFLNKELGECRLPVDNSLYGPDGVITQEFKKYFTEE